MPQKCSICRHPEREAIDSELLEGRPLRQIAARCSVSMTALQRHKTGHVSLKLVKARDAEVASSADDLLRTVCELLAEAKDSLGRAKDEGRYGQVASNIREALRATELLAKLRGELNAGTTTTTVNIVAAPEWLSLRQVLLEALRPYPAAAQAVSRALQQAQAALPPSDHRSDGGPEKGA